MLAQEYVEGRRNSRTEGERRGPRQVEAKGQRQKPTQEKGKGRRISIETPEIASKTGDEASIERSDQGQRRRSAIAQEVGRSAMSKCVKS